MEYKRLCESDFRFMRIIWDNEPIGSGELVKKCEEQLGWKKSTTYTMLKKLCEKGLAKNDGSLVTALVKRDTVIRQESESFIGTTFGGSLPGFLTAFLGGRKISQREAEELKRLIDEHKE